MTVLSSMQETLFNLKRFEAACHVCEGPKLHFYWYWIILLFLRLYDVVLTLWTLYRRQNDVVCLLDLNGSRSTVQQYVREPRELVFTK